jgi:hypothetical protein
VWSFQIAKEVEAFGDLVLYAPVTAPMIEASDFEALIAAFRTSDSNLYDAAGFVIERAGTFYYGGTSINQLEGPGTQHNPRLLEVRVTHVTRLSMLS